MTEFNLTVALLGFSALVLFVMGISGSSIAGALARDHVKVARATLVVSAVCHLLAMAFLFVIGRDFA